MLLYQSIANDIHTSTQVEINRPFKHKDKRMHLLDLKTLEDVSSKIVIGAKSALSMSTKRTVLVQEGLRILLNCSRDIPWKNKAKHLDYLSLRMQYSGY